MLGGLSHAAAKACLMLSLFCSQNIGFQGDFTSLTMKVFGWGFLYVLWGFI